MTSLLSTPRRVAEISVRPLTDRPVVVAAAVLAVQAVALSLLTILVVVLVGWATAADTGASAREAVAASMYTWLLAHHGHLAVPGGDFGLPPVGLTAASAWLLFAGAQRVARSCGVVDNRGVVAFTSVLAATFAVLATVVALVARTEAVRPLPVSAFLGAATVAAAAGGLGALRSAGTAGALWRRVPLRVRLGLRAGVAATVVLLAGGAILAAASLAAHFGDVVRLVEVLDPGTSGLLLLALVSVAYLPTATVWATSYTLGPGFAVGAGSDVALHGVELAATPAFPLLAALPAAAEPATLAYTVLGLPVVAGVVAGLLLDRADRRRKVSVLATKRQIVTMGGAAGLVCGGLLIACTVVVDGPGGPGRLADVGPSWWQTGLVGCSAVAILAPLTIFVCRQGRIRLRRTSSAG